MVEKIFGTFGVRGIFNKDLFPETANLLGRALGTYLGKGKKVAIGHDTRLSCGDLQKALIKGLLSTGCEIYKFGCVGTPLTSFFIPRKKIDAGVMITASHNPKEYNGLKFWNADGSGFRTEQDREIERIYFSRQFNSVPHNEYIKVRFIENLNQEYIQQVKKRIDVDTIKKANFSVVADCGHGCACHVLPQLLKELGCNVIPLFSEPDGSFPGRSSEPIEENLSEIKKLVKKYHADLGVAQDGDADRAVHIDGEGQYQMGDRSFALACYAFLKGKGGTIISTVSTGTVVEDAAKLVNARVLYSIVGEPKIVAMMKKENADIGGEENGGVIYKDWSYARDGIFTTALLLELMAKENKSFKELNEMLPKYEQIKIKIPCPNEKKKNLLIKIKEKISDDLKIIDIDGIRIIYPDGWLLYRPSGTEPIFRIMAEAKTKRRIEELKKFAIELVNNILSEI
ncbi:MAG: phosphoglucosamine mutase [Candidatus Helarchaeota archaeon]